MDPLAALSALIARCCGPLHAKCRLAAKGRGRRLRWQCVLSLYAGVPLALLTGLSLALCVAFHAAGFLNLGAGTAGGSLSPLPAAAPLVAALVSVVLLPSLPLARTLERSLRRLLVSLGGFPLPALDLGRRLRRGPSFLLSALRRPLAGRGGQLAA